MLMVKPVIKIKIVFNCTLFSFRRMIENVQKFFQTDEHNFKKQNQGCESKIKLVKCNKTIETHRNIELKEKREIDLVKDKSSSCIST